MYRLMKRARKNLLRKVLQNRLLCSRFIIIFSRSDFLNLCLFVELSDEGMEYLVQQEKDRASESQVCYLVHS